MFLALNELLKEKSRFILIIVVIILISYLTFFLTSLAYGLASSYTRGIEKWNASGIVLNKDASRAVERSLLFEADYKPLVDENVALLGVGSATTSSEMSEDVTTFGISFDDFLAPNVTEGRLPRTATEVVVSDELKSNNVKVDDTISFKGSEQQFTVVGFTNNATFQTAPIIYMELDRWRNLASDIAGMTGMRDLTTVSTLVTRGGTNPSSFNTDKTEWLSIRDYSFELPGYQAQILTFGLMIGFLIAIASFVLAVFMYILTLQKKNIFGVLKAEGVPSSYIAASVMIQIILLSIIGLSVGLLLTFLSGALLGSAVPFLINPLFIVAIFGLFIVCAAVGGVASVRAVTKIDPVEAIA